jgi:hypothetical protein
MDFAVAMRLKRQDGLSNTEKEMHCGKRRLYKPVGKQQPLVVAIHQPQSSGYGAGTVSSTPVGGERCVGGREGRATARTFSQQVQPPA